MSCATPVVALRYVFSSDVPMEPFSFSTARSSASRLIIMTLSPTVLVFVISSAFISIKETSVVREEERTMSDTLKVLYRTGSENVRIRLPSSRSRVK